MMTIAEMSLDDLKQLIEVTIDARLTHRLGTFEIPDEPETDAEDDWDTIRASIQHHRWTPPPGSRSSLELLREDRES
jgi:hypothetical protein